MRAPGVRGPRLTLAVLALLALMQCDAPHAWMSIVWRLAVVSYDNPATQALDELASGTSPVTDPAGAARHCVRVPAARCVRLPVAHDAATPSEPAQRAGVTRAPPLA